MADEVKPVDYHNEGVHSSYAATHVNYANSSLLTGFINTSSLRNNNTQLYLYSIHSNFLFLCEFTIYTKV